MGLCRALGEWDAAEAHAYGIASDVVLDLYHNETSSSLATKYNAADAGMFIARWEGSPAGCLAFNPFDETAFEIHKFYVDPQFRGKGIGSALMRATLSEVEKGRRRTILVHTTVYMKDAVSLYESFGFTRCSPFRSVPASVSHSEIFMSRPI